MWWLCEHPFQYARPSRQTIRDCLQKKRILVCNDLHYANALLSPHFIYNMELHDDQHVIVGLMRIFQKLFNTDKEFHAVRVELNSYFHILLLYYRDHIWSPVGMKEVAHVWWFTSGSIKKLFPCIVWKILVQVVSSSSCKRN